MTLWTTRRGHEGRERRRRRERAPISFARSDWLALTAVAETFFPQPAFAEFRSLLQFAVHFDSSCDWYDRPSECPKALLVQYFELGEETVKVNARSDV